jgi:hypothetical protein
MFGIYKGTVSFCGPVAESELFWPETDPFKTSNTKNKKRSRDK